MATTVRGRSKAPRRPSGLDWLKARQEHQERVDAAWRVVLGAALFDSLK